VFDYILFISIILYNTTGMSHVKRHDTLTTTLCNCTLWINIGFYAEQYLLLWEFMNPQRWQQASLLNKVIVNLFVQHTPMKLSVHKI